MKKAILVFYGILGAALTHANPYCMVMDHVDPFSDTIPKELTYIVYDYAVDRTQGTISLSSEEWSAIPNVPITVTGDLHADMLTLHARLYTAVYNDALLEAKKKGIDIEDVENLQKNYGRQGTQLIVHEIEAACAESTQRWIEIFIHTLVKAKQVREVGRVSLSSNGKWEWDWKNVEQ